MSWPTASGRWLVPAEVSRRRTIARALATLAACAAAAVAASAVAPSAAFADSAAIVPASAFSDYVQTNFGPSDDGSWPCGPADASGPVACPVAGDNGPTAVPLGFPVDFYGTKYTSAYINNNGNITFSTYLTTYTPPDITTFGSPIIAPFFADVDTRGAGSGIVNFATGVLDGHLAFVVNWPSVGCFDANSTVSDTFQVILIDRSDLGSSPTNGDDFDIEFNYGHIDWDTGQANGGNGSCTAGNSSAVVGFSNGTSTAGDSYELPGSGTTGAFLDSNTSTGLINNDLGTTTLGSYIFSVINGQPNQEPEPGATSPAISGDAAVGSQLSVTAGDWTAFPAPTYTYAWQDCQDTSGDGCTTVQTDQTSSTTDDYTPTSSDAGSYMQVVVTASNGIGSPGQATSNVVGPVTGGPFNDSLPAVTGTLGQGLPLGVNVGTWTSSPALTSGDYSYQWESCTSNTDLSTCSGVGTNSSSYTPVESDVGKYIAVTVTANNGDSSTSAASPLVGPVPGGPDNDSLPAVTGTLGQGLPLGVNVGTWTSSPGITGYSYQWESCTSNTDLSTCSGVGTNSSSYTPVELDVGKYIEVTVTASNGIGSPGQATSNVVGPVTGGPFNDSLPAVTGTLGQGLPLGVNVGTWTSSPALTSGDYSYQWESCTSNTDLSTCSGVGTNSSSYTPVESDVGKYIAVTVTANNGDSSTSAASPLVGPVPGGPDNDSLPAVTGTLGQGLPLGVNVGTWTSSPGITGYTYAWYSCSGSSPSSCSTTPEGTGANYTPTESDVSNYLEVTVTASNGSSTTSATSPLVGPVPGGPYNDSLPAVTGTLGQGLPLGVNVGTWTSSPGITGYTYAWYSCSTASSSSCAGTPEGSGSAYTPVESDVGKYLEVVVTAKNGDSSTSAASPLVGPVPGGPDNDSLPAVTGTLGQGLPLGVNVGTWTSSPGITGYTYAWYSCSGSSPSSCSTTPEGTGANYTPTESDVSNYLEVVVTASNGGNSTSAASPLVGQIPGGPDNDTKPSITGTPAVGTQLSINLGHWTSYPSLTSSSYSYAWYSCSTASTTSCGSTVIGTAPTFTPAAAQAGQYLEVIVTADNGHSSTPATSPEVGPVAELPTNAGGAGLPTISGTVQQGQLLTATSGTWTGSPPPPYTYTYTWLSCPTSGCSTVAGPSATNTYTPTASDVGNTIEVEVTATNGVSQQGNATSAKTVPVLIAAPAINSPPTITGGANAQEGVTLTATNGTWANSPTSYTYQWQECDGSGGGCIDVGSGGTSQMYTPAAPDVGFTLEVEVTAQNNGGSATVSSAPTATVLIGVPQLTGVPQISGTAQSGQTLTASTGIWTNSPDTFDYQWSQCDSSGNNCTTVGQNANTYVIPTGSGAVGDTFRVTVTAYDAGGSATSTSDPSEPVSIAPPSYTALPQISGTVQQGRLLTSSTGTWDNSPASFTYQWEQCDPSGSNCNDVATATSNPNYTPSAADVGQTIRVTVTAHNSTGNTQATSSQTATVLIAAPAYTELPQISGGDIQGQTLTAAFGSWDNFPDPSLFTYQWYQCDPSGNTCGQIQTATSNAYTPLIGDVGHTLRVAVTATNAGGTTGATSGPTAVIAGLQASVPPPVLGQSTDLAPVTGTVLIKLPGSNTFVPVTGPISVPNGTTIDATQGTVTLTQQLPDGSYQSGQFYDGEFVVDQTKGGQLYATLTGGSFAGCTNIKGGRGASTASAKKKSKTVVRQLWGNAHGNYTTKGKYGSASVSGTVWVTQDRCDGTFIKAIKDTVIVVAYTHPHHKHKLKQGQSILLPKP